MKTVAKLVASVVIAWFGGKIAFLVLMNESFLPYFISAILPDSFVEPSLVVTLYVCRIAVFAVLLFTWVIDQTRKNIP